MAFYSRINSLLFDVWKKDILHFKLIQITYYSTRWTDPVYWFLSLRILEVLPANCTLYTNYHFGFYTIYRITSFFQINFKLNKRATQFYGDFRNFESEWISYMQFISQRIIKGHARQLSRKENRDVRGNYSSGVFGYLKRANIMQGNSKFDVFIKHFLSNYFFRESEETKSSWGNSMITK